MAPDEVATARLLAWYRRYVGEPEREADVYVGFALFFGGIVLGIVGLAVFLWSTGVARGTFFWRLRELALVLAFLGMPAFALSVVVLLPVNPRAVYAGVGGTVLCVIAVGVFVAVYPSNWNVQGAADYSAQGIALYAAGLAVLVGSTGTALVAHHIERAQSGVPAGATGDAGESTTGDGGATGTAGSPAEAVTDEQVRRDVEESMADAELTWGGVHKAETKRLRIQTDDVEVDRSTLDRSTATTSRSAGVDDAVAGLRKLQGGGREQATGEGIDSQTAALKELRERQHAEREADAADGLGVLGRVKRSLGRE